MKNYVMRILDRTTETLPGQILVAVVCWAVLGTALYFVLSAVLIGFFASVCKLSGIPMDEC